MLKKITDDIYQLVVRFPFGMREVNSYLFKGEKGFTVIDTGSYAKESIDIWERTLASGVKVEKVVLTHAHPDHIGLAGWFQERFNVPVFISSLGYKEMQRLRLQKYDKNKLHLLFQQHDGPEIPENIMQMEESAYDFEPDGLFEKNQTIQLGSSFYETIWTPGHAPDHICFYHHDQQIMVVGDHVLNNISPIILIPSEDDGNPLKDYFSSLESIKRYPIVFALPGHGDLIYHFKNRVEEITARHHHRLQQTLDLVKSVEKTAGQVCQEVYGKLSISKLISPFIATITRFLYLESIGKVEKEMKNGKIYYRASSK
ncbi:MBL fold metallo-hydrolase [Bacillus sp. EB600]|uniref:MBL fold metallo-hydrolase n=1 Tax=Bacillus sp. EB600 TaxID=2806345 RepID=UPI00210C47F1|nr:MBL fold metallo-hydrolase [Bacillus sp. EB600]MCQ6279084.1 MBL fold metallo-hydrolase [Bacillus sp. EB600]